MSVSYYFTAVNGVLWAQSGTTTPIYSYDKGLTSAEETYTMKVRTAPYRPGPVALSSGRVRAVSVLGKTLATHTFRTRLLADDKQRVILNKSRSMTVEVPTKWPSGITPEMRATQQRCMFVSVELSATPAYGAEWTAVELWASGTDDRHLSRRRS